MSEEPTKRGPTHGTWGYTPPTNPQGGGAWGWFNPDPGQEGWDYGSNYYGIPQNARPIWAGVTPGQIYGDYMYPGMISGPYNFGGSRYQNIGGYQNLSGGPANWFNANQPNFNTGNTPQAMNPMNVINASLPLIEREQEKSFARAAARAGKAGMLSGSPYHADVANIAKESSDKIGSMYFDTLNQAANQQAARQMQAAQALQGQGEYFQQQPTNMINMLNQMGMQQYSAAQNAMQLQYQDWLRRMYSNRQDALATMGNQRGDTLAQPRSQGSNGSEWLPIIAGIIGAFASDESLKQNISKIGTKNGINLYEFEYKTNPGVKRVGVMAQEIEKTHPHAVFNAGKYKAVMYSMLPIWS